MLVTGESPFDYHYKDDGVLNRSGARMTLAIAYVRYGYSFADFAADLKDPAYRASVWYRTRADGRLRKPDPLLLKDWRKAEAWVRSHPSHQLPMEVLQKLGVIRSEVATARWVGRAGSRNRLVLSACLAESTRVVTPGLQASVRSVADLSGISKTSAQRALEDLEETGWMTLTRTPTTDGAGLYRFDVPEVEHNEVPIPVEEAKYTTDFWTGLGPIPSHIHDVLLQGPATVSEIVELSGHTRKTVGQHLKRLAGDNLADVDQDRRWHAVPGPSPEELAELYGFTGRLSRQRERHLRERMARREHMPPAQRRRLEEQAAYLLNPTAS